MAGVDVMINGIFYGAGIVGLVLFALLVLVVFGMCWEQVGREQKAEKERNKR